MLKSSTIQPSGKILSPGVMTPEQSRAARGWLGWSQEEFAKKANVALRTVAAFERGGQMPRPNNITAMCRAIEAAGIRLLFDETGQAAGIARRETAGDLSSPGD